MTIILFPVIFSILLFRNRIRQLYDAGQIRLEHGEASPDRIPGCHQPLHMAAYIAATVARMETWRTKRKYGLVMQKLEEVFYPKCQPALDGSNLMLEDFSNHAKPRFKGFQLCHDYNHRVGGCTSQATHGEFCGEPGDQRLHLCTWLMIGMILVKYSKKG